MTVIGGMLAAWESAAEESATAGATDVITRLAAGGEFGLEEVVVCDEESDERDEIFLRVGIEGFPLIGDAGCTDGRGRQRVQVV